jgi:hypothetical protein
MSKEMERFSEIWENRDSLARSLHQMADRMETPDELHTRLKAFLKSDLALLFVARDMEYRSVEAHEAAREWLAQIVTKNESDKYEITVDSTDDLKNRTEEFYRQFRELRRRGRLVDEFAAQVADSEVKSAMQSLFGKLSLTRLVASAADRPDVDGTELWFGIHFQETPAGLILNDWAGEVIDQILDEASEIDRELTKQDF